MLGKNHIKVGISAYAMLTVGTLAVAKSSETNILHRLKPAAENTIRYLTTNGPVPIPKTGFNIDLIPQHLTLNLDAIIFTTVCGILYIVGNILLDIDSPSSMLGRYFYLPIQHRTWSHSIWPILVLLILGIFFRPLTWLALGCIMHLIVDSFSQGGNCWFYPLSKYIDYDGGAHVKKRHFWKLYRVGSTRETIITVVIMTLAVVVVFEGYMNGILF